MKTKHLLISILLMLLSAGAYAQGENNVWTMGDGLGLDFNGGGPVFFSNNIFASEGCAAVSDSSGKLLFYTNGESVQDNLMSSMTNGLGLLGKITTTQGAGIAPVRGMDNLYFLFTLSEFATKGNLNYSLVNMALGSGYGDVEKSVKNIFLGEGMSEKMTFAGSGSSRWLITHHKDSGIFYAFNISAPSFVPPPVISKVGPFIGPYWAGEMKASRNSDKLSLANSSPYFKRSSLEIYDFDTLTGMVSNCLQIDTGNWVYGLDFSPNGKLLYTTANDTYGMYQYNLSLSTADSIRKSRFLVFSDTAVVSGIRRGPDNKVYAIVGTYPHYITNFSRIQNPDVIGSGCNFQRNFLSPGFKKTFPCYTLGNAFLPITNKSPDTLHKTHYKTLCKGDTMNLTNGWYKSYNWIDGSHSNILTISKPGTYWVKSVADYITSFDTFIVSHSPLDSTYGLFKDTTVCIGKTINISVSSLSREWYRWSDGDTIKIKSIKSPAVVVLTSKLNCTIYFDTVRINALDTIYKSSTTDTSICPNDSANIFGRAWGAKFTWFDGSHFKSKNIKKSGKYWVQSFRECLIWTDTFNISVNAKVSSYHTTDTSFCESTKKLTLSSTSEADNYSWNTGDTSKSILISKTGKYWVSSLKDCRLFVDTFYVYKTLFKLKTEKVDSIICFKDSIKIAGPDSCDLYKWWNGSENKSLMIYKSQIYFLTATNYKRCEILNKSFKISLVDFSSNLKDTFICNEDTITLDATISNPSANYRWQNGDTNVKIKTGNEGINYVFISVEGCTIIDSIEVKKFPASVNIGNDTTLCKGTKTILKADVDNVSYKWSTGQTTQSIEVSETGNYGVTIFKDACSGKSEIKISFVNCDNCTAFPTGFTPNNDGINDYFKPILNCPPVSYQLKIMNRWGQEVYTSSNPNDKWDGTSNGHALDGGVYFYMLKVKFEAQNDEEKMFKGEITLLR